MLVFSREFQLWIKIYSNQELNSVKDVGNQDAQIKDEEGKLDG